MLHSSEEGKKKEKRKKGGTWTHAHQGQRKMEERCSRHQSLKPVEKTTKYVISLQPTEKISVELQRYPRCSLWRTPGSIYLLWQEESCSPAWSRFILQDMEGGNPYWNRGNVCGERAGREKLLWTEPNLSFPIFHTPLKAGEVDSG